MNYGTYAEATITRPANTTAYNAGDVVGGLITLQTSFGSPSSQVLITDSNFRWDVGSIPSGATSFTLHLYSSSPASAYADNAAWDLPSGDRSAYLGQFSLGTPVDQGATAYVEVNKVNKVIKMTETSLYAYIVTVGAYTPASESVQFLRLYGAGLWFAA